MTLDAPQDLFPRNARWSSSRQITIQLICARVQLATLLVGRRAYVRVAAEPLPELVRLLPVLRVRWKHEAVISAVSESDPAR